ncbi:hypothetical protein GQ54DRAFT_310699 [Martensiomyces pterosporus]|nr:hypothetical protein GQ54DRAFT_310699 [Martensiomyces pterosporus]
MFDETVLDRAWYIVDIAISSFTLLLNMFVILKRRKLLRLPIFRTVTILQVLSFAKSVLQMVIGYHKIKGEANCRVVVFFGLVTSVAPLFATDFCVLYLQLILIKNIERDQHWVFVAIIVAAAVFSVVPEAMVLVVPPRLLKLQSYCEYDAIPSKELIIFKWFTTFTWIIVAGLIGIWSLTVILRHVMKTSSRVESAINCSRYSDAAHFTVDEARRLKRARINHALLHIAWVPVTPIISMWFAVTYGTIRYAKQRNYTSLDSISTTLQCLSVPFIAAIFYAYAPVRREFVSIYREYRGLPYLPGDRGSQLMSRRHSAAQSSTVLKPQTEEELV